MRISRDIVPANHELVIKRALFCLSGCGGSSLHGRCFRGLQQERVLNRVRGGRAGIVRFHYREIALRQPVAGRRRCAVGDWIGRSGLIPDLSHHALMDTPNELNDRQAARKRAVACRRTSGELRFRLVKVEPAAEILHRLLATDVNQRLLVPVIGLRRHALGRGVDPGLGEIGNRENLISCAAEKAILPEQRDGSV